jgi:hypothetical protein
MHAHPLTDEETQHENHRAAGLAAARAIWLAAPHEVRTEVHQLSVTEGDVVMSYDLTVVLPRTTVEDGISRAVARANRAARV